MCVRVFLLHQKCYQTICCGENCRRTEHHRFTSIQWKIVGGADRQRVQV